MHIHRSLCMYTHSSDIYRHIHIHIFTVVLQVFFRIVRAYYHYSVYWYKITNTDTKDAASASSYLQCDACTPPPRARLLSLCRYADVCWRMLTYLQSDAYAPPPVYIYLYAYIHTYIHTHTHTHTHTHKHTHTHTHKHTHTHTRTYIYLECDAY
jgi:hypothetical protein